MIDAGIEQQQRALAEIVQDQRREHQRKPRQADRLLAEVSHVGVQRFPAGDDEEHGAEHGEAGEAVGGKERDGVTRIERAEDRRQAHDPATPSTASITNQTTMIGPKSPPTRCVPYF